MAERGIERITESPVWVILDWLAQYLYQQPAIQTLATLTIESQQEVNLLDISKAKLPAIILYPTRRDNRDLEVTKLDIGIWIIARSPRVDLRSLELDILADQVFYAMNSIHPRRLAPMGWPARFGIELIGLVIDRFEYRRTYGGVDPAIADGVWRGRVDFSAPTEWSGIQENYLP